MKMNVGQDYGYLVFLFFARVVVQEGAQNVVGLFVTESLGDTNVYYGVVKHLFVFSSRRFRYYATQIGVPEGGRILISVFFCRVSFGYVIAHFEHASRHNGIPLILRRRVPLRSSLSSLPLVVDSKYALVTENGVIKLRVKVEDGVVRREGKLRDVAKDGPHGFFWGGVLGFKPPQPPPTILESPSRPIFRVGVVRI